MLHSQRSALSETRSGIVEKALALILTSSYRLMVTINFGLDCLQIYAFFADGTTILPQLYPYDVFAISVAAKVVDDPVVS